MRRLALFALGGGLIAYVAFGAIAGCGDDEVVVGPPGAQDGSASNSETGTTGTSGGTPTGTSGGPTPQNDSGNNNPPGTTSNPGKITCGNVECDAGGGNGGGGGQCCVRQEGPVCQNRGGGQGQGNGCDGDDDIRIRCDEPKDCPSIGGGQNEVQGSCCLRQDGQECGLPFNCIQVCKTTADCVNDAGTCAEKTCRGRKVMVCGTPQGCQ